VENEELYARAAFGRQVELFWASAVGEYLRNRAQECYTNAVDALKNVDPTDVKKIVRAQGDVWKAETLERWMSEAIMDGLKALDLIENPGEDE